MSEAKIVEVTEWVINSDGPGEQRPSLRKAQWLVRKPGGRGWGEGRAKSGARESRSLRESGRLSAGGLENAGQESRRPSEWEVKTAECQQQRPCEWEGGSGRPIEWEAQRVEVQSGAWRVGVQAQRLETESVGG